MSKLQAIMDSVKALEKRFDARKPLRPTWQIEQREELKKLKAIPKEKRSKEEETRIEELQYKYSDL